MHFLTDQRFGDVLEGQLVLGEVPGIVWTPASTSTSAPLILLGHPGGLHTMFPRLLARARRATVDGIVTDVAPNDIDSWLRARLAT